MGDCFSEGWTIACLGMLTRCLFLLGLCLCASLLPSAICCTRHNQPPLQETQDFLLCVEFELSTPPGSLSRLLCLQDSLKSPAPGPVFNLVTHCSQALVYLTLSAHGFESTTAVFVSMSLGSNPERLRLFKCFVDEAVCPLSAEFLRRNGSVHSNRV